MKRTTKSIRQQELQTQIIELIDELEYSLNNPGKYDRFQMRLESLISIHDTEHSLLPDILKSLKMTSRLRHSAPYWDYATKKLETLMDEHEKIPTGQIKLPKRNKTSGLGVQNAKRPSFVEIGRELADEDKFVRFFKQYRFSCVVIEFFENLETYKNKLRSFSKITWNVIRKLLLLDQVDRLFIWLFENHRERKFLVDIITILSFVCKLLWMLLLLVPYIFNPFNILRKMLPREIDDAIPTEY